MLLILNYIYLTIIHCLNVENYWKINLFVLKIGP